MPSGQLNTNSFGDHLKIFRGGLERLYMYDADSFEWWDELYEAELFIHKNIKRFTPFVLNTKIKYGTIRHDAYFLRGPFRVLDGFRKDNFLKRRVRHMLGWWFLIVYGVVVKLAVLKWPFLAKEILTDSWLDILGYDMKYFGWKDGTHI